MVGRISECHPSKYSALLQSVKWSITCACCKGKDLGRYSSETNRTAKLFFSARRVARRVTALGETPALWAPTCPQLVEFLRWTSGKRLQIRVLRQAVPKPRLLSPL